MSSLSQKSAGKSVALPTLKTSASILTLITASGFVGFANAQTVILDGNTVTVTSQADGEMISAGDGVTSTVDGAPVVLINTNDVTLDNDGTLATVNGSQTVQAAADTTGATINNSATGVLNGDSRVVQIDGNGATLNNDGQIIGTGNQRNGTVPPQTSPSTIPAQLTLAWAMKAQAFLLKVLRQAQQSTLIIPAPFRVAGKLAQARQPQATASALNAHAMLAP